MKGVIERKRPVKLFKLMIDEATFFHFKAGRFCGLLIYIGATGDAAPAAEVNKDENNGTFTPFSMHIVPHPSLSLFFKHLFFFNLILLLLVSWCFTLHFTDYRLKRKKKQSVLDECVVNFYSHF